MTGDDDLAVAAQTCADDMAARMLINAADEQRVLALTQALALTMEAADPRTRIAERCVALALLLRQMLDGQPGVVRRIVYAGIVRLADCGAASSPPDVVH